MKKILTFLFVLAIIGPVLAVPQFINYQGVLRDDQARLVTGSKSMTFKLYDAASGGTALWQLTTAEVVVSNGLYNIKLGPLGYNELGSGSRWLEVSIGSEILSPRLELLSIAYAITAGSAETARTCGNTDTVDGFHASGTATAGQLLPLDGNKQIKGVSVSTEASSGFALFVGGRVGANVGGAGTVGNPETAPFGVATIGTANNEGDVFNSNVTTTSLIILTQGTYSGGNFDNGGVYVKSQASGTFKIRTGNGGLTGGGQSLKVNYLVIN